MVTDKTFEALRIELAIQESNKNLDTDVEHAMALIRDGIQHGRYVPGQRLVEIDLIGQLGVSRGRIREALRRLSAEGLVQIEKNRGASVRKISREEVGDIFEVLTDVSVISVRRAMQNMKSTENRKRIAESLEIARRFSKRPDPVREVSEYMEENARFWDSIAAVVDNPVLVDTRMRLQVLLFRLQFQGLIITDREKWITLHEEILAAMLEGKSDLAEGLVHGSSEAVKDAMLSLPDSAFG